MNGFLPSKGELKRRHVAREDYCEGCGVEGESLYHVAFNCTFATQFWRAAKEITGCKVPVLHPQTWARDILSSYLCSEKDPTIIVCGVWSLWSGRNNRRHGKVNRNTNAAVKHDATMIEDLICLQLPTQIKPARGRCPWQKLEVGWCKVNSDAAFVSESLLGTGEW
ncbi:hypothetical protein HU200_016973 [Digitaria exilis]|uniref:Reverse transcriptase zinc-binding domain-containing protein n=1 Tax=Digitaria exilis TaxID=1010633 RepID=A0A835KHV5_9POAL|nr:hypothetical protein HU200_016973 [Digitaria exilis]